MVLEQLKADYRLIYKTLRDEGQMRAKVFPVGHPLRKAKLEEIGFALQALLRIKELLKAHLLINPEPEEQMVLFEVAERKEYR